MEYFLILVGIGFVVLSIVVLVGVLGIFKYIFKMKKDSKGIIIEIIPTDDFYKKN